MDFNSHEFKEFSLRAGIRILYIAGGGAFIGFFHHKPVLLTVVLLGVLLQYFLFRHKNTALYGSRLSVLCGTLLSAVLGFISEWVGTEKTWWIYRYYEQTSIKFPPWVPLAWAVAFVLLHKLEREFSLVTKNTYLRSIGVLLFFLIFPPVGEIIAIAFGTWRYTFTPQFLGMPLQAVLLIALVHYLNRAIYSVFKK